MKLTTVCLALMVTLALNIQGNAADWGHLTGTFKYEGTAPKPAEMQITKDQPVCGKYQSEIVEQGLLVGEAGGVENVMIWLKPAMGKTVPVHPEVEKAASSPVVLDNLHCMFKPHALGLWAKHQTLVVKNSDPIAQALKIDPVRNPPINVALAIDGTVEQKFQLGERLPAAVTCGIHPWESAYLLISETPYFAITDSSGKFAIRNIPAGDWEFQVWHERSGYLNASPKWKAGRFTQNIKYAEVNLGTLTVTPALFKKK